MSCGVVLPPSPRNQQAAVQTGRLTSPPVTEFTAQHGKIPTKTRSPPLLQPDADFGTLWAGSPLERTALKAPTAPGGGGGVPPNTLSSAPRGCGCEQPHLCGALRARLCCLRQPEITQEQAPQTQDYFAVTLPTLPWESPNCRKAICLGHRLSPMGTPTPEQVGHPGAPPASTGWAGFATHQPCQKAKPKVL